MIKIRNLTKIYKSKKSTDCIALNNVNITLPDSGMVFVIGKSGSGKSTLLNLIGSLDTLTSGTINIDGNNLEKLKSKYLDSYRSSYLTFIFQDYKLFENLTVKQNLEVGLDINDSLDYEVIKNALKRVGLEDYENRYPYELSGGQQQRVAIARALSRNSKLILADEPTGNLDYNTSKQILDILKEVSKEKLVVIVSHNLNDADIYADRIIELHDGKIISDKIKRDNYKNNFEINNEQIVLPHYHNLDSNQTITMNNSIKEGKITKVIQNDNGFIDFEYKEKDINKIEFNSKKPKIKSLFKIFKMFLTKKVHTRLVMVLFSVLLFTVLSVLQSFILYEPNATSIDNNNEYFVLNKEDSLPFPHTLRSTRLHSIEDFEYNDIVNIDNNTKIYKLNNSCLPITSTTPNAAIKISNQLYQYEYFYTKFTNGVLVCDETYLNNLSETNKVEVLCGNLYEKPYGIIITDYVADCMINYGLVGSYEDILGDFYYRTVYKMGYINAIIKTDYKNKYLNKIPQLLDDLHKKSTNEEELEKAMYNLVNTSELFKNYINDHKQIYNISYSLNPNFRKDFLNSNLLTYHHMSNMSLSFNDYILDKTQSYSGLNFYSEENIAISDIYAVNDGEIYLYYDTYNELFNTSYSSKDYDLSVNNKVVITFYNNINGKQVKVFEKEYKIVGLSNCTILAQKDFNEILQYQIIDYGLYIENNNSSNDIINYANNHGFLVDTIDFESGLVVNKMTTAFNLLFTIILVCIYIVFGLYIILYGVGTVKNNKNEIGIYKAIGGKFRNIAKVLFVDIILTGIIISILTIFFTPFIISVSDKIVVDSFKDILNLAAVNLKIIKIYPEILALNYLFLNMLIIISAVVPVFLLAKLKPVEIMKN